MKLTIIMFSILVGGFARAASHESGNNVKGIIGFSQSAVNFGADYEKRLNGMGVGGYFLYSSEKKDAGKNQTISIGAMAPAHVMDDHHLDVYIAPGFGITMVKGLSPQDDQTVFGPSVKTGILFKMTPAVQLGLDTIYLVNWFSDKVGPSVTYTNFAVNFGF